jgi:ribosome-binding factor A
MGFYTTRFVAANNEKEAELKAVNSLKRDKKMLDTVLNKERGIEKVPMIYLESTEEIF